MGEAERLAAIWEAAETIDDDGLLLGVLTAMRDPTFRADVAGLLRSGPRTRQAMRVLLRLDEKREAANSDVTGSLGDEPRKR